MIRLLCVGLLLLPARGLAQEYAEVGAFSVLTRTEPATAQRDVTVVTPAVIGAERVGLGWRCDDGLAVALVFPDRPRAADQDLSARWRFDDGASTLADWRVVGSGSIALLTPARVDAFTAAARDARLLVLRTDGRRDLAETWVFDLTGARAALGRLPCVPRAVLSVALHAAGTR